MDEIFETGYTMDQAEELVTSILRRNNLLRAPSSGETPNVPRPEDVDTGERTRIFKGIKQVTFEEYTNLTEEERKQYVFFVRESADATFGFVGIGNLKYTMVPEDIRGIDCGFFPVCSGDTPDTGETPDTGSTEQPDYLTFISAADGNFINLIRRNNPRNPQIYYTRDDGETWVDWTANGFAQIDDFNEGDVIKMYGENPSGLASNTSYRTVSFSFNNETYASGNVMSLISQSCPNEIPDNAEYCFSMLFFDTLLLTAPNLPATTLSYYCYYQMFYGCTLLEEIPDLPATTLSDYCYYQMFGNCVSLREIPDFSEVTLKEFCYGYMFRGCTSLTKTPNLPTTELARGCYNSMFQYCTGLTQLSPLPATTMAEYCYSGMFSGCASLTETMALPAMTLANECYAQMFSECTSLTAAPELPATELAKGCYVHMFDMCESLIEAPALPATTLAVMCYMYMFSGCISLTASPVLSAKTLVDECYEGMFNECSSLAEIRCYATENIPTMYNTTNTREWCVNVGQNGVFYKNREATNWATNTWSGIPTQYGWTIVDVDVE